MWGSGGRPATRMAQHVPVRPGLLQPLAKGLWQPVGLCQPLPPLLPVLPPVFLPPNALPPVAGHCQVVSSR